MAVSPRIAIVGMACEYPDAPTPDTLWENTLAARRSFRRLPDERLRSGDYLDPNPAAPDKSYVLRAAVLDGWTFDRVRFRVAGGTFRSADLAHWLALDVAARALADAGFPDGEGLPRESTGVLIGNSLTGQFSRANLMRLRWPYVRRVVDAELTEAGIAPEARGELLRSLEARYKSPFTPVGEETLAGGLANTIAGRICNHFDLKGGGYTIDGACSSSLLAVANACSALTAGDLDVAMAGGVDLGLDPFEIVGFAKVGALAADEMRVFDERAAGFWPGEGCGAIVLMREEDAVAQGRRVIAVVRGWGISSDGAGGLTRPEVEGQLLAVRRAYRRAGYDIGTVSYFEGHGTGTTVGDATELAVLTTARDEAGAEGPAVVGSVKANIGHTKAAAGVAGLLRATLAVRDGVLPPTAGTERPHPGLSRGSQPLRVLSRPEPWTDDRTRRAGVSSMGFGGINVHVTLEASVNASTRRAPVPARVQRAAQDTELFVLAAPDPDALAAAVDRIACVTPELSRAELVDLAASLAASLAAKSAGDDGACRAAIVAGTPESLVAGLDRVASEIITATNARSTSGPNPVTIVDPQAGVFLRLPSPGNAPPPRVGFLFPGQGAPSHVDGGGLRRRFTVAEHFYADPDRTLPIDGDDVWTAVAQPAIVTASIATARVLESIGLTGDVGTGHSLGELTALAWGGVYTDDDARTIAAVRGRAMAEVAGPPGSMASLGCDASRAKALIAEEAVVVAGLNADNLTVISGPTDAVTHVVSRAREAGVKALPVRVSHAFHSPLMAPSAEPLAAHLESTMRRNPSRSIVSTVTGRSLGPDDDIRATLVRQVTAPVRFAEAIRALGPVDLLIEVGPGRVLTGLAARTTNVPVVPTDGGGASLGGVLGAVGAAWALGAPVRIDALFADRFVRAIDLTRTRQFLQSPCEQAPVSEPHVGSDIASVPELESIVLDSGDLDSGDLVRALVARRAELPIDGIGEDLHLLDDLHLDSIAVGEIVVEATRRLGLAPPVAPNEFADSTVRALALAVAQLAEVDAHGDAAIPPVEHVPPGVDEWVRSFTVAWRDAPEITEGAGSANASWRVIGRESDPLVQTLRTFTGTGSRGADTIVCMPAAPDDDDLVMLLEAGRECLGGGRFVLVQRDRSTVAGFVRTLHEEAAGASTCVVTVPVRIADPELMATAKRILAETAMSGHHEVSLGPDGTRQIPELRALPTPDPLAPIEHDWPLGKNDVLLVTGGGKGIAAECALAIATKTGAGLALVGRSSPDTDDELRANLDRFTAAGARAHYARADVSDPDQVRRAVTESEAALGCVTGVLHGAGRNAPTLIRSLNASTLRETLAPKVDGLRHVLGAVDPERLRVLVTFGSIIARIGMRGEADYALANEQLTCDTESFAARYPHCRCRAIEWSVWSGAGMGERLGRIESLAREGVTAITPERGVAVLEELLRRSDLPVSVVVTGRFGTPATVRLLGPDLPLHRFLETPRVYIPGVELVTEAEISPERDPYLDDHALSGDRVLPGVMGLEAMAQAAAALAGTDGVDGFEDVRFAHPVVVSGRDPVTLRLAALVRAPGVIDVVLRSSVTGFARDHFRATCRTGTSPASRSERDPVAGVATTETGARLALDPTRELYEPLLFQRGRFHRIDGYRELSATACQVDLAPDGHVQWFGAFLPTNLVLGDPGARDAALHAIQACIPHARILPTGVDRIEVCALPATASLRTAAVERHRDGNRFVYDLDLIGPDGVCERWIGLRLQAVESIPTARLAPALWAPYIERRVEELLPGHGLRVAIGPDGGRKGASDDILAEVARTLPIHRRPDGKPDGVSAAHADGLVLAVGGESNPVCDLEIVRPRSTEMWTGLLGGPGRELAVLLETSYGDSLDVAGTRVWSARECMKKAGAAPDIPIVLDRTTEDGWTILAAGDHRVATTVACRPEDDAVFVVAVACADAQPST